MNSIQFETQLYEVRDRQYRYREVDIVREGFRPLGGMPADFTIIEHASRFHLFAIERRLQEGLPFYPGHEAYFCHASTADFCHWQVHDPVLWVRPGTWEEAHVWAPCVVRRGDRFIMAYTGANRACSQDIGFASSEDLCEWQRWDSNPLSPARGRPWAFWRREAIASCRDPHLLVHGDRLYMTYTTNTREGASCIAMQSTADLHIWQDHGPILIGPPDGYAADEQDQLESSNLLWRSGRWFLLTQGAHAGSGVSNWIYQSDRPDHFEYGMGWEFWRGAYTVEIVKDRGQTSLLACTGPIRLGQVDWSQDRPTAGFLATQRELEAWLDAKHDMEHRP
jgi:predicted GH43/DUF377 family glycosyl hydrolase